VMLTVTPRVNPGGLVIMDVQQEVSNVAQGLTTEGVESPTFRTRNIESSVAVQHGQVVVLGGLIRDEKEDNKSGIPGLYKVPVLGWLFGQEGSNTTRTELVVVIQPRVISNTADADKVMNDFRKRLKGLKGEFWGHQGAQTIGVQPQVGVSAVP